MGFVNRKKSGKKLNGTTMIVPGQGISVVQGPESDKKIPKSTK